MDPSDNPGPLDPNLRCQDGQPRTSCNQRPLAQKTHILRLLICKGLRYKGFESLRRHVIGTLDDEDYKLPNFLFRPKRGSIEVLWSLIAPQGMSTWNEEVRNLSADPRFLIPSLSTRMQCSYPKPWLRCLMQKPLLLCLWALDPYRLDRLLALAMMSEYSATTTAPEPTTTISEQAGDVYIYIYISANWRVGHLGILTSPFSPSNTLKRGRRGGGPRQAPKGGTKSWCPRRPWTPMDPPPGKPHNPGPPGPQMLDLVSACPEVWTAFYEAARSEAACFLKLVLLTVLDLCLCLCLTRVSCCGHPSIH